jgi:hypothetical protein
MDETEVRSLLADLDEAIDLLRGAGVTHWQNWLQRGRDQIARGDAHGADHVLAAYGGMGSFNDLVLDARSADDRLHDLRGSIWFGCRAVKGLLGP